MLVLVVFKVVVKCWLVDLLSCWDKEVIDNVVEIYVLWLCGKLGDGGFVICMVCGIGYCIDV